jgi:hypothetical protein
MGKFANSKSFNASSLIKEIQMSDNQTQDQTQEQTNQVVPNFDNKVDIKEFKFNFKTTKDKETGEEFKRESIELKLPIPSIEGIVAILEAGGKQLELLQEAVAAVVVAQARSILNDNDAMIADNFPTTDCTWEAIANMPEAEKRGRGIPKEVWDDFCTDYIAVMPGLAGKTSEQVTLAAALFGKKLTPVKTNKKALAKLAEQLAIYANGAPQAEQYFDCVKFLDEKIKLLLTADTAKVEDVL